MNETLCRFVHVETSHFWAFQWLIHATLDALKSSHLSQWSNIHLLIATIEASNQAAKS